MSLALVTGASRGIGREIALALANAGHNVIAVSRTPNAAETNPRITSIAGDISDLAFVTDLHKKVTAEHGNVEILINAAGIFGPIALIQDSDPHQWLETIMIDAISSYYTSRAFLPAMLDARWGRIINLSSAASLHQPGKLNSAYATAKVALNQFTRHLAAEISGSGVTANVIHPGDVRSEMWADISAKADALGEAGVDYKSWVDWVEKTGGDDPKKAADLIMKLVSDKSADINGEFLWIDNPLQAPIDSWDKPVDAPPWL
ncbi:MAG: SDR family NAD(P)-dependent oxidoreductase [Actinobacteria bacterium]|nr:SDR family NAD(P)-dependent oxidoreductase [Actinomycetota bacterium]